MRIWQIEALDQNAFLVAGSVAYVSFCVNPIIYASRYEVFRRYLKQMLNMGPVASAGNTGGITNSTHAAHR